MLCMMNPCEVGDTTDVNWFARVGYHTTALLGVGADGIQQLINVLNSVSGWLSSLIGISAIPGGVVGGALAALAGVLGFVIAGLGAVAAVLYFIDAFNQINGALKQLNTLHAYALTHSDVYIAVRLEDNTIWAPIQPGGQLPFDWLDVVQIE